MVIIFETHIMLFIKKHTPICYSSKGFIYSPTKSPQYFFPQIEIFKSSCEVFSFFVYNRNIYRRKTKDRNVSFFQYHAALVVTLPIKTETSVTLTNKHSTITKKSA